MATTLDDVTHDVTSQSATGNGMQSPTSRGIAYYFEATIVFIGIVGTAANALIVYAMVESKQHRKQLMIFNQNVLDLFSSILLIATYGAKLAGIRLVGSFGYYLCLWFLSENILWCGILASKVNLMLVTVERYLKVVHHYTQTFTTKQTEQFWTKELKTMIPFRYQLLSNIVLTYV